MARFSLSQAAEEATGVTSGGGLTLIALDKITLTTARCLNTVIRLSGVFVCLCCAAVCARLLFQGFFFSKRETYSTFAITVNIHVT